MEITPENVTVFPVNAVIHLISIIDNVQAEIILYTTDCNYKRFSGPNARNKDFFLNLLMRCIFHLFNDIKQPEAHHIQQ